MIQYLIKHTGGLHFHKIIPMPYPVNTVFHTERVPILLGKWSTIKWVPTFTKGIPYFWENRDAGVTKNLVFKEIWHSLNFKIFLGVSV